MRGLLWALALSPLAAMAAPSSTFDGGAEGWSVVDLNPPYDAAGSSYAVVHKDGHIEFSDPSSQSFFFEAPSSFLGSLSAYYGGTLSYSQKLSPTAPAWRDDPDVVLVGAGLTLVFQNASNPGADWTDYSIALVDTGWRVGTLGGAAASSQQLQDVLGNLDRLRIRGEYVNGVVETTALDNVSITAVPEPGEWSMMLAGLGVIAGVAHRRRAAWDQATSRTS